jgi:PAS domain S-box-containing protein
VAESLIDLTGLQVGAEDFLTAVLEAAAQPVWVVDHDGLIRFANPAALSALGYERPEELIGRHSHATIHARHRDGSPFPASECRLLQPLTTGETVTSELDWFIRRDGATFPVAYTAVPVELPTGRGSVVVFDDIENRLRAEHVLSDQDGVLAEQQASLRRVAALVAGGAAATDVFAAIAREAGRVIGLPLVAVWRYELDGTATVVGAWSDQPHPFQVGSRWPLDGPTITARVLRTGRPGRIDDFSVVGGTIAEAARGTGIHACAGAPIVVDGRIWGAMSVDATGSEPLPAGIEDRLVEFTELAAATFSTTARQEELARLAEEQAALRRVATLVAQAVPAAELFGAVTAEVGRLLRTDAAATIRYGTGDVVTPVGNWSAEGVQADTEVGLEFPLAGDSLAPRILRTGRPARIDDWGDVPGQIADYVRTRLGVSSSVGSPILVEGRVWGNLAVHSAGGPLPPDTEERLARFTELVATAIVNAQARSDVERLADEQAALRRVATLVARQRPPAEVFAAVAEEVGRLLPIENTAMFRYEDDGSATIVASWGAMRDSLVVGSNVPVEGENVTARVRRTGQPARFDDYGGAASGTLGVSMRELGVSAAVGCPVTVDGRLWGIVVAAQRRHEPLPAETESRVAEFTELIATAVANIQAREDLAASRARIVAAADDERRRVVRDLHDGAQQRLVHSVVTMKLTREALENDPAAAPPLLEEALSNGEQAVAELRELAHGILPAVLTRGGLRAGLGALASRIPLPVELDVHDGRLPPPVEATAYFVVAEALTNVAKHARATHVSVTAHIDGADLRVDVRDDGIGGARSVGTGLLGLGDRLAAQDGRLSVESPPDGGTLVTATIPLTVAPATH